MRMRYQKVVVHLQIVLTDAFVSEEADDQFVADAVKRWNDNQPTVNAMRDDNGIMRMTIEEESL